MTDTTTRARWEPSAWMRARMGDALHKVDRLGLDSTDTTVIAPLVGQLTAPGTRADRTCDRCDRYVPKTRPFYAFPVLARPRVLFTCGMCRRCARKEGVAR